MSQEILRSESQRFDTKPPANANRWLFQPPASTKSYDNVAETIEVRPWLYRAHLRP